MSFVTIPDIDNQPVMVNTKCIETISINEGVIALRMSSGDIVATNMPRQILVQMLTKVDMKPEVVQTSTEWAG